MKPIDVNEACESRGYDLQQIEAAAAMMPPALQKFVRAVTLRAVVAEAINEGRVPDLNDGQWKREAIFDLTAKGPSGLGLAFYDSDRWIARTGVGARLQFYDVEDIRYFGNHPAFQELHHDALTYKVDNQS